MDNRETALLAVADDASAGPIDGTEHDPARTATRAGVRIQADGVAVVRRGHTLLRDASLRIEAGEVVAIVGASGAGKSTLLRAIAGVGPATSGTVRFDGVATASDGRVRRDLVGYVPQDDLIHRDLPVGATLRYAAQLRLPAGTLPSEVELAVGGVLADLELTDRRDVRVGDLSGGQRKRASIAVELLTRPRAFFLDEPTSGLDPFTATRLMASLRRLAARGTTVVLTTHSTDDVQACDRMVVVEQGGVTFAGSPAEALARFGVDRLADVYLRHEREVGSPRAVAPEIRTEEPSADRSGATSGCEPGERKGALAQWTVLTRRDVDILRRNRLTLAVMVGAPVLVIAMFALLFRAHALDARRPDPAAAVSTAYWMAFAAFFFGLTYGLLQICTEIAIVRRERFVGLRVGPYLAAKAAVLAPVLLGVDTAMLAVLRVLDRLPPAEGATYARLLLTLVLTSLAALALGLLASAAVADPAQATLALPMLCFPAVLFAGAVVPVPTMAIGGRAISTVVVARWAFEAAGRDLALGSLLANDSRGPGRMLLADYGDTFTGSAAGHWVILAVFSAGLLACAARVLRRRTTPS